VHRQLHLRYIFGDRMTVTCRDDAHIIFSMMTKEPSKVSQGDFVFVVQSEFILRSVLATLQVSVCPDVNRGGTNCNRCTQTHTQRQHFDKVI